jgi:hypothetical protein
LGPHFGRSRAELVRGAVAGAILTALLGLAVVAFAGCGGPGPVAAIEEPISLGDADWLCAPSSWNPLSDVRQWPEHGWCRWTPAAQTTTFPPNVGWCTSTPPTIGQADIYDGDNYTGQCARISILAGPGDLVMDWRYVAVNGWDTIRRVGKSMTLTWTKIHSFRLGPYVNLVSYSGPIPTGVYNYPSFGIGRSPIGQGIPSFAYLGLDPNFEMASIEIWVSP